MKERFGAKDENSLKLRFHTQTAGCTLTAQQPENNIIRVTIQALASVLGGTQSLHTNSLDEALALPTEESVRIALRTQQIIAHESGVTDSADPLGGSYLVESLTNEIEKRAAAYIETIEGMGGALEAIEKGYIQHEIQESAYRYQQMVERGELVVVGVNRFQQEAEETPETLRIDPAVEKAQLAKLAKVKAERDSGRVASHLASLKGAAAEGDNLMPLILAAVRDYVTLGEIAGALREVFGEYREGITI